MRVTGEQLVFAREAPPAASRVPTTDAEYLLLAYQAYDNPQCSGLDEFKVDLNRADVVAKSFKRYVKCGELNTHLILNHLIIIFNIFGTDGVPLLFGRLSPEEYSVAATFLKFISRYPSEGIKSIGLDTSEPECDEKVEHMLEELIHA